MVDPFIQWNPERLQLVGFAVALAGASVLATIPLSEFDTTPRVRLLLAGCIGVSSYYFIGEHPTLMTVITFGSVAITVLIPLAMSLRVVRDLINR